MIIKKELQLALALVACSAANLPAQNLYWGAGGSISPNNSWATAGNWYTDAGETAVSGATPTMSNDVIFNTTPDNALGGTIAMSANVSFLANSLTFNTSAATSFDQGNNARTLTLGSGGITLNSGSGAVAFNGSSSSLWLQAESNQTWTNNATSGLTVRRLRAANTATGPVTVTLSATNTGNITFVAAVTDSLDGTKALGLVIDSAGSGTVSLSGATYSGGTTVKRGTLLASGNVGTGTVTLGQSGETSLARVSVNGTATANFVAQAGHVGQLALTSTTGGIFSGTILLNNNLSVGTVSSTNQSADYTGVISGTGNLTVGRVLTGTSNPTVTFGNANTYTGKTIIESATLNVASLNSVVGGTASSSLGAPITLANGTIGMGAVSTSTLKYNGTGETTDRVLDLAGTTSGAILDQSGTGLLKFSSALTATGAGTKTLTLQGSTAGTGEIAGTIVDNSGTNKTNVTKAGTGTWTLSGANTYTGITTINGGVLGVSTLANGGVASGLGQSSNAATNLVINGGTLQYLGAASSTDRIFTVGTSGATLDGSGSGAVNFTASTITLSGTNTARTLAFTGSNTGNNTLAAVIANNGTGATTVTKDGVGRWVLSGTNTYTGATTVSAGTLMVSGTINSSSGVAVNGGTFNYTNNTTALNRAVTVAGGNFKYNSTQAYSGSLTFTSGTVSGTGNLSGTALTIGAGQTLSPGNSPGTLATGAETWVNGGTYLWEINALATSSTPGTEGADPGWDFANITGALTITAGVGQFNLNVDSLLALDNWNSAGTYQWRIATASGGVTGFNANIFNINTSAFSDQNSISGGSFSVSNVGNDVFLNYAAVPEPSTYAMLAMGLGSLWLLRRKRKV